MLLRQHSPASSAKVLTGGAGSGRRWWIVPSALATCKCPQCAVFPPAPTRRANDGCSTGQSKAAAASRGCGGNGGRIGAECRSTSQHVGRCRRRTTPSGQRLQACRVDRREPRAAGPLAGAANRAAAAPICIRSLAGRTRRELAGSSLRRFRVSLAPDI